MKTIKCACGASILLDDTSYEIVKNQTITYKITGRSIGFSIRLKHGTSWMPLANYIKNWYGVLFDHEDRNIHNNLLSNLRPCNKSQNAANRRKMKNNTSGFIGVSFDLSTQKYRARVRQINVGLFSTPEEAALARDEKALELYGVFAVLNFPLTMV